MMPPPIYAPSSLKYVDHTYRDYSRYVEDGGELIKHKKSGNNFPARLHAMLSNEEHSDVITWMPHGRAWKILDKNRLISEVIPNYYVCKKYESFSRQLNGWGFKRLHQSGPDFGCYYHQCFLRDMPELTCMIRRLPPNLGKSTPFAEGEPNFYRIAEEYPLPPPPRNKASVSLNTTRARAASLESVSFVDNSLGAREDNGSWDDLSGKIRDFPALTISPAVQDIGHPKYDIGPTKNVARASSHPNAAPPAVDGYYYRSNSHGGYYGHPSPYPTSYGSYYSADHQPYYNHPPTTHHEVPLSHGQSGPRAYSPGIQYHPDTVGLHPRPSFHFAPPLANEVVTENHNPQVLPRPSFMRGSTYPQETQMYCQATSYPAKEYPVNSSGGPPPPPASTSVNCLAHPESDDCFAKHEELPTTDQQKNVVVDPFEPIPLSRSFSEKQDDVHHTSGEEQKDEKQKVVEAEVVHKME